MIQYFKNIVQTSSSLLYGLKITLRHFFQARHMRKPVGVEDKTYFDQKDGIVTLQYPYEELPVPDTGRYQLHNEIDDCIVCDKCAKVCPVNCIDIEPIKATEEIGKTSDGTPRRLYAAKFDIDMSKCCFCGLCTVVCPTECLTMTKEYDFSVYDLNKHNFVFGDMSPELIAEKKAELEVHNAQKEKEKAEKAATKTAVGTVKPVGFRPKIKLPSNPEEGEVKAVAKPSFKPKMKTKAVDGEASAKPKPAFRPKMKPSKDIEDGQEKESTEAKPKPVFKPKMKPVMKAKSEEAEPSEKPKAARPVFKPKVKPVVKSDEPVSPVEQPEKVKPAKPVFRPKIKKKEEDDGDSNEEPKGQIINEQEEIKKSRPVFRPKMKPKKKD